MDLKENSEFQKNYWRKILNFKHGIEESFFMKNNRKKILNKKMTRKKS